MTLNEAISELSDVAYMHSFTTGQKLWDAAKIGIEAMKRERERRKKLPTIYHTLLPGETEH